MFLDELLGLVEFVEITAQIDECRDPKDNKYLELAISGEAEPTLCDRVEFLPNTDTDRYRVLQYN